MESSMSSIIDHVVATPDPPPRGVPNPIHDADGAAAAGYAGALVAGVRTYGWAVQSIVRGLGAEWLENGWVDFTLRRPLFAGELLNIELKPGATAWSLECSVSNDDGTRVVLDGTAGLGNAEWAAELQLPEPGPALEAPDELPSYTIDSVPLNQPLRPLRAYVANETAHAMVREDLSLNEADASTFTEQGRVHPYFLAGRMAPLTRHNFTYGPTIHVRSQIQHTRAPLADSAFVVGAQIVDAYERNEHWYQILDGVVTDEQGEICRIRHHTIFRPRGT